MELPVKTKLPEKFRPYKYTGEDHDEKSIIFLNDYKFLERYSELLNPINITSYPDVFNFSLQVRVTNYIIKENIFTYVKYTLEGLYDNREFYVERRYKEFLAFRRLLCQNFPGVFIPPIPPKKSFGNLEEGFIKLRKKFLQHFFNRICAAPHLSSSQATKLFLESRIDNFSELPTEIYQKSIFQIYEFYDEYFKFLADNNENFEISNKDKNSVQNFYMKLIKTKDNLENFLYIATESQNIKIESEKEIQNFYENFYDLDNNYILDMFKLDKDFKEKFNKDLIECGFTENLYKTKFESGTTNIYEWANLELIDVEAMIESISSLFKYKEQLDKKLILLKKENDELENMVKPSWVTGFLFQTDLKMIQTKTIEVETLKNDVETLQKLIDKIYKILFFVEIPVFKRDKVRFYYKFLEYITNCESHGREKTLNLYSLLKEHCINTLEIYKNKVQK
jgi:hypothetical protein